MTLCFIQPDETIRAIADSLAVDGRHQLFIEVVRSWVDCVPEGELQHHYARVVTDLDDEELTLLAAWHASLDVGTPLASRDFLVGAFPALGENRREALRLAAGFNGTATIGECFDLEDALTRVLPWLSDVSLKELQAIALEIYVWDRLGNEN